VSGVTVVPLDASAHLAQIVEVLHRVRRAHGTYPPTGSVADTPSDLAHWFDPDGPYLARWVAVLGDDVVGHVAVSTPHDYMLGFLESAPGHDLSAERTCEIVKVFVDPEAQRCGAGRALLDHALDFAASRSLTATLAVISTSVEARRLYPRSGMTEIGSFAGVDGINHIFVAGDAVGARPTRLSRTTAALQ